MALKHTIICAKKLEFTQKHEVPTEIKATGIYLYNVNTDRIDNDNGCASEVVYSLEERSGAEKHIISIRFEDPEFVKKLKNSFDGDERASVSTDGQTFTWQVSHPQKLKREVKKFVSDSVNDALTLLSGVLPASFAM